MQVELGLPSIGGKDSMSGTFQDINVPPMLMAFGITTVDASKVISTDLKGAGHRIYLVRHTPLENRMPDTAQLKENFAFVSGQAESGKILSAWSVGFGGVGEGLAKMAFGNGIGAEVTMDESGFTNTPTARSSSSARARSNIPAPNSWASPSPRRR